MKVLTSAAMSTLGKVLFVILAHLRRDPGDVIAPAGQDGAYYSICTSGCCHRKKSLIIPTSSGTKRIRAANWRRLLWVGCRYARIGFALPQLTRQELGISLNRTARLPYKRAQPLAYHCNTVLKLPGQNVIDSRGTCWEATSNLLAKRLARPLSARSAATRANSGRLLLSERCARIT